MLEKLFDAIGASYSFDGELLYEVTGTDEQLREIGGKLDEDGYTCDNGAFGAVFGVRFEGRQYSKLLVFHDEGNTDNKGYLIITA